MWSSPRLNCDLTRDQLKFQYRFLLCGILCSSHKTLESGTINNQQSATTMNQPGLPKDDSHTEPEENANIQNRIRLSKISISNSLATIAAWKHAIAPPCSKVKQRRRSRRKNFPWQLRRMLNDAEIEGNGHIVGWTSDGLSFKVYNPKEFADSIMQRYFKHSNFRSFQRQVSLEPDRVWKPNQNQTYTNISL